MTIPGDNGKPCCVSITPPDLVEHCGTEWPGLKVDVVSATRIEPFEYRFHGDHHVLIAAEVSERADGETIVEGLPKSTQRRLSQRLTFIPAGRTFWGWQKPRVLACATYFHIDRRGPLLDDESGFPRAEFLPRLFFSDCDLWRVALALKNAAIGPKRQRYGEALGIILGHELVRLNCGVAPTVLARGGLTVWQQRKVTDYIEANLDQEVRLTTLASLVGLSPYHFARAFKQSTGQPPLFYHSSRRIARAKALLAKPGASVTRVALELGFTETSSFSAAFRRNTGMTPRDFRRSRG